VGVFLLWQEKGDVIYLVMSGVVAGITSCFAAQKGLLLLASFFLIIILIDKRPVDSEKSILNRTGPLVAGYVGLGGSVFLFFYTQGGLPDLVYSTFLWPLANYHNVNIVPYGFGLFEFFWPSWLNILQHFLPETVSQGLRGVFLVPFVFILSLPFLVAVLTLISCRGPSNRPRFSIQQRLHTCAAALPCGYRKFTGWIYSMPFGARHCFLSLSSVSGIPVTKK